MVVLVSSQLGLRYFVFRAASVGDYDIVDFFMKKGADIGIKETNYGKNAEKIAEELAYAKIVDLLRSSK